MPRPETQEPTVDERGQEHHPAFGKAIIHRTSNTPGAVLFDSEIRHPSTVTLTFTGAVRERGLNRDWIFADKTLFEVEMSEVQWGALVSAFNQGDGVPVTIRTTAAQRTPIERTPELPYEPRLALSTEETRTAAERAFEQIKAAAEKISEKPTKANIRSLMIAIDNAPKNVEFASESLTEHVENVVTKARADILGMVEQHAATLGITAADTPALALGSALGDPQDSDVVDADVVEE